MKRHYFILIILLCCIKSFSQNSFINSVDVPKPSTLVHDHTIDLFASEEVLQMQLIFDMKKFIRTKNKQEYFPATLTVKFNETDSVSLNIKIKARGFMRLNYCSFPPIMLKFKDSEQPFGKENLKLVTHCNNFSTSENYVFKEYLAYKLFNQVTPYSFKTRLVRITYVDVHNSKKITAYGFLIENEEKLAERNNSLVVKNLQISQKHMNPTDMARLAVFNYMIGNTDWSIQLQHNIKVLQSLESISDKGIPVAYDFDYSGMVNTNYSAPTAGIPIKNVTERHYMGLCFEDEELKPVLEEFEGLHDEFLKTIREFEYLSTTEKTHVEKYIQGFYKNNRNQNYLVTDLNKTCKRY
jgi:hypothetical protein